MWVFSGETGIAADCLFYMHSKKGWSALSSLVILRGGQHCEGGKKERSASDVHTARSYSRSTFKAVPHFDQSVMLRATFYFARYGDVESAVCVDNFINKCFAD